MCTIYAKYCVIIPRYTLLSFNHIGRFYIIIDVYTKRYFESSMYYARHRIFKLFTADDFYKIFGDKK